MRTYNPPSELKLPCGKLANIACIALPSLKNSPVSHRINFFIEDRSYLVDIPASKYTRTYVESFILAFKHNPEWRENFRSFTEPHQHVEVAGCEVDSGIARIVEKFTAIGHFIHSCCEGDKHPVGRPPIIKFCGVPPRELLEIAKKLDWVNIDPTVIAPPSIRGSGIQTHKAFILLLDDWLNGHADTSARRYRVRRETIPELPPLPAVNAKALKDQTRQVKKLIKRANSKGMNNSFNEMVRLRSGRDQFSRMKDAQLRELLKGDPALQSIETLFQDDSIQRKAMRWRLRGLEMQAIILKMSANEKLLRRIESKGRKEDSYDQIN